MGLQHYYDDKKGKWVTHGFRFRREYDTEEQMRADSHNAFESYLNVLEAWRAVGNMLLALR